MNSKTLGLVRELLMAVSVALLTYGIGSEALWQEVTGGIVALITLVFSVYYHTGREAWYSLARKVLSSVGGVLVITGTLDPSKVEVLIGVVSSCLSLVWTFYAKDSAENAQSPNP